MIELKMIFHSVNVNVLLQFETLLSHAAALARRRRGELVLETV